MSIGTITFTLPEEQDQFTEAQNGTVYRGILQDIDNWLRNRIKHGQVAGAQLYVAQDVKALESVRDELLAMAAVKGVTIWD